MPKHICCYFRPVTEQYNICRRLVYYKIYPTFTQLMWLRYGKPQKSYLFSGPATKALPSPHHPPFPCGLLCPGGVPDNFERGINSIFKTNILLLTCCCCCLLKVTIVASGGCRKFELVIGYFLSTAGSSYKTPCRPKIL